MVAVGNRWPPLVRQHLFWLSRHSTQTTSETVVGGVPVLHRVVGDYCGPGKPVRTGYSTRPVLRVVSYCTFACSQQAWKELFECNPSSFGRRHSSHIATILSHGCLSSCSTQYQLTSSRRDSLGMPQSDIAPPSALVKLWHSFVKVGGWRLLDFHSWRLQLTDGLILYLGCHLFVNLFRKKPKEPGDNRIRVLLFLVSGFLQPGTFWPLDINVLPVNFGS